MPTAVGRSIKRNVVVADRLSIYVFFTSVQLLNVSADAE